nr:hypothetical membrane protein, ion channel family [uncultured archaeon]
MCEYKFRNGDICQEEALQNSKYCILHIDLPEDKKSEEFKRINELKEEKVKEKISKGDFNFEGAKLLVVDFNGLSVKGDVNFINAVIAYVSFAEAKIGVCALFEGAEIDWVWFWGVKISGTVRFIGAKIGHVYFNYATIGGNARFEEAEIRGMVGFERAEIKKKLIFKNTKFRIPMAQEEACRKAKIICENLGNRADVDYYFYREMEARRKQKNPIIRFLELPVQYIFGYGVHPWRVIATWLLTVFSLAFVYWLGNGVEAADSLVEYIYFSVVTVATPGYGGYHPKPGIYQGLASFEAIFGTFMWAAFIATFARKYMR